MAESFFSNRIFSVKGAICPFPRKRGYNPPISMTYFCVPEKLARQLAFYPVNWTQTDPKGNGSSLLLDEELVDKVN